MSTKIKKQKGLEQYPVSVQPSGAQMLSLMEQYYNVGLRYCFVKNKPVLLFGSNFKSSVTLNPVRCKQIYIYISLSTFSNKFSLL